MANKNIFFCAFLLLIVASCRKNDLGTLPGNPANVADTASLPELSINGAICPYDSASTTFYFPVSLDSVFTGFKIGFDTSKAEYIFMNGKKYMNGDVASLPLKTNDSVKIEACKTPDDTSEYRLIITGLPLVQLTGNPDVGDDYEDVAFSIIDPDYVSHTGNFYVTSNAGIKIRGATAREFPKKAFALQTYDASGNDLDTSLLGLRSDQNWILDAMYIDFAKMRNRLCTDLWNSFNNVPYIAKEPDAHNGTRGYLVEVFMNKEYHGVYCLTEKLDRKQLQVKKKTGYVYKSDDWTDAVEFRGAEPYDNDSTTWNGWEVSYPDDGDDRPVNWSDLYDFVSFADTSSDYTFKNNISQHIDMNNMIDYLLFINAVGAEDNVSKNAYFSIYDTTESQQFFYSVWDLDGTMGRDWDGQYYQNGSFQFLGRDTLNNLLQRLIGLNPDNFISNLKARWQVLKNGSLNPANVDNLIEHYARLLSKTNAAQREAVRWPGTIEDISVETNYMMEWYTQHISSLDSYISSL